MSLNRSLSNLGIPEPDCVCFSWKLELNSNILYMFLYHICTNHTCTYYVRTCIVTPCTYCPKDIVMPCTYILGTNFEDF